MKKSVLVLLSAIIVLTGCGKRAEAPAEEKAETGAKESSETAGNLLPAEELEKIIVDTYMAKFAPEGEYVIFDTENEETEESIRFVVRYRPSDREEEEMIASGKGPVANIYVTTVTYYKGTQALTDENGLDLREGRTE